jgi:hypothetical protein
MHQEIRLINVVRTRICLPDEYLEGCTRISETAIKADKQKQCEMCHSYLILLQKIVECTHEPVYNCKTVTLLAL